MPTTVNAARARDAGAAREGTRRASASPGDRIGDRYLVEEVLGSGGMGVVLAARHEALGQRVAIKLVSASTLVHTDVFARFAREARIIASLESEHVVRVVDYGMHAGAPYMVMELLAGRDLGRELEMRGPLPVAEAVDYVIEACEGLSVAHAKGIVHRDVKPANLFVALRADGERAVKVLDFGVSKLQVEGQDDGQLTRTTSVLGSPMYMSPEQIRDPRDVDARADVWSLGVVLYRILTNGAPFEGVNASSTCAAIVADPPRPLEERAPHVPEGLRAVILRCLAKQRDLRVPSVAALARELAPFASPRGASIAAALVLRAASDGVLEPQWATPPGAEAPSARDVEPVDAPAATAAPRRGGVVWAAAAAGIAVVAIGAVGLTRAVQHGPPAAAAATAPPTAAASPSPPAADPTPVAPPSASLVVAGPGSPSPSAAPVAPPPSATATPPAPSAAPVPPARRAWAPAARTSAPRPAATPTTHFGGSALDDHH